MKPIQQMIPSLFVLFCGFYLLPFFGRDTGSFMLILLMIIPGLCLVVSIYQGYRYGMQFLYPILVGMLFAPTLAIYYNYTAWVYIILYALIALFGMGLGNLFHKGRGRI
jgi:hypothetical protein